MFTIMKIDPLQSTYNSDVVSHMENILAEELSKEINDEILLDVLSPETKGWLKEDRWKSIRRNQKIDSIFE